MNDILRPLPRDVKPFDAVSSAPASSSDSFDSYNGDDARPFLREWRVAQNSYSEATRENSQLKIHLRASQATLHAAEEEASAIRERLVESDATVTGKTGFRDIFIPISIVFILIVLPFL